MSGWSIVFMRTVVMYLLGRYAESGSGMIFKLGIDLEGPWRSARRAGAARGE